LTVMRDRRPVTVEVTTDGAGLVSHAGSAGDQVDADATLITEHSETEKAAENYKGGYAFTRCRHTWTRPGRRSVACCAWGTRARTPPRITRRCWTGAWRRSRRVHREPRDLGARRFRRRDARFLDYCREGSIEARFADTAGSAAWLHRVQSVAPGETRARRQLAKAQQPTPGRLPPGARQAIRICGPCRARTVNM